MTHYPVSLVLIVYNTGKLIENCLESLRGQMFQDFELIVINNDSDNETTQLLLQGLKWFGDRVQLIENSENVGGAVAGNQGIQSAQGDYVFLMDADDELPFGALKALYAKAKGAGCDIVIGRGNSIIGRQVCPNKFMYDWMAWAQEKEITSITQAPELLMAPFYWGKLYRREFLLQHKIFMKPGRLNADRYFNSKALLFSKKTVVIMDESYRWRRHNAPQVGSVTQKMRTIEHFLDRLQSTYEVDELYRMNVPESTYFYVRLAGLLRLLLPIDEVKNKEEFRKEYFAAMHQYLQDMPLEAIEACRFLPSKKKLLLYLLKQARFDDVCRILQNEIPSKRREEAGVYLYEYQGLENLPAGVCTQPLHKLTSCVCRKQISNPVKYCFTAEPKYIVEDFLLLHIWITDRFGQEIEEVPFHYSQKEQSITITLQKAGLDNLQLEQPYFFTLEYWMNGIVTRSPCNRNTQNKIFVFTVKTGGLPWKRERKLSIVNQTFRLRKRQGDEPLLISEQT